MSNPGSLGPLRRFAGIFSAFELVVCVAGVGQLHGMGAIAQSSAVVQRAISLYGEHTARMASPESEFEEALALRRRLTQRDLTSALRLLQESAQRFAASGLPRQAAAAKLEAGDVYLMMSLYQQALGVYHQVLRTSEDRVDQRCAALGRIARTYANIGRLDDSQHYSDEAISDCAAISDKKVQADAVEAQGETRLASGDLTDAIASFTRARELASDAKDHDGEARATMMLSWAINVNGQDHQQANLLALSALAEFVDTGNEYSAARTHLNLAFYASGEGDFEVARCHCESALAVFENIADKDNAAIALNILGMVARQAGDLEESLRDYQRAQADFASVHDDLGEAESISALADILLSQHKNTGLEPLFVRKLHLAQATSNRALLASALVDIAGVYARQHRYARADEDYQRGLAEFRAGGNHYFEGVTMERMALLRAEQRGYQDAVQMLDAAQALMNQAGQIEDLARIQYLQARIYLQLGDLEKARSEIERTITIIESQRLRIAKFDSRAQYFASVHEYYSFYIQVLMALEKSHPGQRYAQLAFEASERSKVRSLLDLLANTQRTIPCDTLLAADSKSKAIDSDQSPFDTQSLSTTHPLTLDEVQAQIRDVDTVLLEFALGEDQSFVWLVDGDRLTGFAVGPAAEIRNRVVRFRKALLPLEMKENEPTIDYLGRRAAARNSLLLESRQLAKILIGPVRLPPGKRLLIVPDGPLQYLPFAALPISEDGHVDLPLAESHELVMLPSASTLLALRKAVDKRPRPADELTVFADPVFEPPGKSVRAAVTSSSESPHSHELTRALRDLRGSQWIPNLPGSRNEALAIQKITGPERTRLVMGFDANREAITSPSIARQRIIHFATHGMMDTRHPEMSGLVLSMFNKKGEYQDGYLRLNDIYNLKLTADLVVLSSCESALGKDLGSEGIIGLPRAFLYAGARSVIASLWKVDDDATVPLMKTFYSRLQQGEDPPAALRAAQLDLLKNPQFSDPYYWAAFVLEGDYR